MLARKNLVLTNKGERPYQPFLGCDVRNRLFELNDRFTEDEIIELCQLSSTDKSEIDTCIIEKSKNNEKY